MGEIGSENQQQSLTPPENAAIIPALLGVEAEEITRTRRVVCLQIVVALTVAGVAYITEGGPQAALALLSGAGVSVANGMLLAWRMSRSSSCVVTEAHPLDAQHQLRRLQFYAAERFLLVAALLSMCMAVLKLPQPEVLAGFVMGQAVLMAARVLLNKFKTKIVTR